MVAVPSSIGSRVVSMRSVVVFPAPLGPRKPKISPRSTSMLTPRTASTVCFLAWNVLRRSWVVMTGSMTSPVAWGVRRTGRAGRRAWWGERFGLRCSGGRGDGVSRRRRVVATRGRARGARGPRARSRGLRARRTRCRRRVVPRTRARPRAAVTRNSSSTQNRRGSRIFWTSSRVACDRASSTCSAWMRRRSWLTASSGASAGRNESAVSNWGYSLAGVLRSSASQSLISWRPASVIS